MQSTGWSNKGLVQDSSGGRGQRTLLPVAWSIIRPPALCQASQASCTSQGVPLFVRVDQRLAACPAFRASLPHSSCASLASQSQRSYATQPEPATSAPQEVAGYGGTATEFRSYPSALGHQTLEAVPQYGGSTTNTVTANHNWGIARVPTPSEIVSAGTSGPAFCRTDNPQPCVHWRCNTDASCGLALLPCRLLR